MKVVLHPQRELTEATRVQAQALREVSAAQQEQLRLREAVQGAEVRLAGAQQQLERCRKEKARMQVGGWRRGSSRLLDTHLKVELWPPQGRILRGRQVETELREQKVEHQLLLESSWEVR